MAGLLLRRALGAILVAATMAGGLTAHAKTAPEGSMVTTAPNGAAERIPVTVVHGARPGPVLALVAGPAPSPAARLGFALPGSGREVVFESSLPADLRVVLDRVRAS